MRTTLRILALGALVAALAVGAAADEPKRLKADIEALKPKAHIWKAVKWNDCLLDGLKESQRRKKPILLWAFIHNPKVERC